MSRAVALEGELFSRGGRCPKSGLEVLVVRSEMLNTRSEMLNIRSEVLNTRSEVLNTRSEMLTTRSEMLTTRSENAPGELRGGRDEGADARGGFETAPRALRSRLHEVSVAQILTTKCSQRAKKSSRNGPTLDSRASGAIAQRSGHVTPSRAKLIANTAA